MLYDWANSAFATTVLAGFFPVFFKTWWAGSMPAARSTALLGTAASASVVLVVAAALLLGALSDVTGTRKRLLLAFCVLGASATAAMALVPRGGALIALVLYVVGTVGYAGGNVFYDALLPLVAPPGRLDSVSARGFALGYAGGGVLLAAQVGIVAFPRAVGLPDEAAAVRLSFVATGLWWVLFAIPLALLVREPRPARSVSPLAEIRASLGRLASTLRSILSYRDLLVFLLAFWCYMDGVGTIVRMATAYGADLGLGTRHLMGALLMVQFIGLPATWIHGLLAARMGRRPVILAGIAAYAAVVVLAYTMSSPLHFFVLAGVVGLFQGGIQAISRSLYASMAPPGRSAEFFGFYTMSERFSAFLGPLVVGWTAGLSSSPRLGILALVPLFVIGASLLLIVDPRRGGARAAMD